MRRLAALVVIILIVATGCSGSGASAQKKLEVVATVSPVFDALGAVGGSRVHATNLVPIDPFASLSATKADELRNASLAVVVGGGFQPHVEEVVAQRTGPTIRLVDELAGDGSADGEVWLDPNNMIVIADLIRRQLQQLDPSGEAKIDKSASRFIRTMFDIDRVNERTIATCKRRDLVTYSPKFGYFANRFGLNQVPVTDANLETVVERTKADTVFWPQLPAIDDAKRIRSEYGVRAATLDDMTARTDQARRGGASYASLMALNLDAIREALDCEKVRLNDK